VRLHVCSVKYAPLVHVIGLVQTSEVGCISGFRICDEKAVQTYI